MDATMENKMGLPPPYEATVPAPPPPGFYGGYPPTASGPAAAPAPAAQPRTVVVGASIRGPTKLGPGPSGTLCNVCSKQIVTCVDYAPNKYTHIAAGVLCLVAWCCCACLVPYCMKSCKTVNHYCPMCKAYLGRTGPRF